MMLVSIIMPTINPLFQLNKALSSIMETASDYSQVEVLLRIDLDNSVRIGELPELERRFGVKALILPRGTGYNDMGSYVDSLLAIAEGRWSWLFDDDAYVEGPWQKRLETVPCDPHRGPICQPEFYHLGPSEYKHPFGPPTPIVPTEWAKRVKTTLPADDCWFYGAKHTMGWGVQTLKDVHYYHDGRPR